MTDQPPPLRPTRPRGVRRAAVIHLGRGLWRLTRPVRQRYTRATEEAEAFENDDQDAPPRRERRKGRRRTRAVAIQSKRAAWRAVRPVRRDKAWTFATLTGVAGVGLMILLALSHLQQGRGLHLADDAALGDSETLTDAPAWEPEGSADLRTAFTDPEPLPPSQADPFADFASPESDPFGARTALEPEPQPEPSPEPEPSFAESNPSWTTIQPREVRPEPVKADPFGAPSIAQEEPRSFDEPRPDEGSWSLDRYVIDREPPKAGVVSADPFGPTESEPPPSDDPLMANDPPSLDAFPAVDPLPAEEPPRDEWPVPGEPLAEEEPPALALPEEEPTDFVIEFARLQLPQEQAEEFLVEAGVSDDTLLGSDQLPADDWLALRRDRRAEGPVKTALYTERVTPETMRQISAEIDAEYEPEAADAADQEVRLAIEKTTPDGAGLRQPVSYEIVVRNEGDRALERVVVEERLPETHEVVDASPAAALEYGALRWQLRSLRPGEEQILNVQLVPTVEGPAESVALIRSFASVAASTLVQGGHLQFAVSAPESVRRGTKCVITFTVTNPGESAVEGAVLRCDLPPGLVHELGRRLDHELDPIGPGETLEIPLAVRADPQGWASGRPASEVVTVAAEVAVRTGQAERSEASVAIYEPGLQIRRWGQRQAPLGEEATFENVVTNLGSTAAREVEVVETVPRGLEVIDVSADGEFDPLTRTVRWRLRQLDAGATERLGLTVRPIQPGEQVTLVAARDDRESARPIRARVQIVDQVAAQGGRGQR